MDEFDKKERLLLNFGHTFGHAMEGASHFAISHGIAVGLGIECAIAYQQNSGVDYSAVTRVARLRSHLSEMIRSDAGLSEQLRKLSVEDVLERFVSDKKHGKDFYALILIAHDGSVVISKEPRTESTLSAVRRAVEQIVEAYA